MRTDHPACPFLNRDDQRCCRRLTLVNLPLAFSVCLGEYQQCPVYRQICAEQAEPVTAGEYAQSA